MVPSSQTISAWIETNLFQDFATMPTGQTNNNSSAKQNTGGRIEQKECLIKRRITRSMTQQALDAISLTTRENSQDSISDDILSLNQDNQDIYNKKGIVESMDDLEEQTAAAQVLQLLGLANIPGSNNKPSNASHANSKRVISNSTIATRDWSQEEDELLKKGINNFGHGEWKEIAETISGRTEDQCRERWNIIVIQPKLDDPSTLQEMEEETLDQTYFETEWGTLTQKLTDSATTSGSLSIDWSSVMDSSLLPDTLSTHKEIDTKIVYSTSQSPKHRVMRENEKYEEFITKDNDSGKQQINDSLEEPGLSADLLITAMAENPQFFYQSATNEFSETPYSVGPESFLISNEKELSNSIYDNKNLEKELSMQSTKRLKIVSREDSQITDGDVQKLQLGYPCLYPHCNKTFVRLYNLKSHQRTHSTDRPFKCPSCETAFARNHDLKRHQKIHENAKPYKCLGCKKLFSRIFQDFNMSTFDDRLDALRRHKQNPKSRESCKDSEIAET
ncbi:7467_t:CDS:2 [Diversispora eburnea]|uniref:7467_t:CDS:1 n=1 Tax=Diversispora eburnea TaxID=1213867 RepID=A0A9N9AB90_9GLOM|nr:7467_t:CDS:2 [Diversispora eburnea]